MENIGLQDSLLSRFDLLFIVLDKVRPTNTAKRWFTKFGISLSEFPHANKITSYVHDSFFFKLHALIIHVSACLVNNVLLHTITN